MVSLRAYLLTPIALALLALPGPAVAHDPPDIGGPQGFLSTIFPRGRLGIEVLPMTPGLRAHFGVDPDVGILVSKVGAKSPAAEAGIEAGDVILAADGKPIRSPHERYSSWAGSQRASSCGSSYPGMARDASSGSSPRGDRG